MQVEKQDNFIIDILKQDFNYDVESRIQEELKRHSDLKIVIIDTFATVSYTHLDVYKRQI